MNNNSKTKECEQCKVLRDELKHTCELHGAGISHELFDMVCAERDTLEAERDVLKAEVEQLKWFANQMNKYVMPGECDSQDSALKAFTRLSAICDRLAEALDHYAALANDDNEFIDICLERAMDLRDREPNNPVINPAGKFMAEIAIKALAEYRSYKNEGVE